MEKTRWICPVAHLYHSEKQIGKGLVSVYGNSVRLLEPYNYNTIIAKAKIYIGDRISIFRVANPKAIGERIYIIKKKKTNQIYYKDIYFNNERK